MCYVHTAVATYVVCVDLHVCTVHGCMYVNTVVWRPLMCGVFGGPMHMVCIGIDLHGVANFTPYICAF